MPRLCRHLCLLQVGVQTSQMQMLPTNSELLSWETFNEDISSADDDSTITVVGLLEQLNVTRDTSDYLWYSTRCDESNFLVCWIYKYCNFTFLFTSIQDWYKFVWVISAWRPASYSHCPVHRPCYACIYQWTSFRYTALLTN